MKIAVTASLLVMAPLTDAAVRADVDRLVAQVSATRHLSFRGSLQAHAVSRDAAEAQISAALAARVTTSNLGAEEQILKRLGLIAPSADYAKLWAAGAAAAPVATYDAAAQRLLVPDFLPLDGQRVPLLHEIAHALADQRFDLRQFLAPPTLHLDGDTTRARLAFVEGDATLAAMEVVDGSGAFLRPTALAALADRLRAVAGEGLSSVGPSEGPTPPAMGTARQSPAVPTRSPWLAELGRFVHVDGFLFVARIRARQPWSAIDAIWRDPPASSEQVLHREKYDACEGPIAVPESVLPTIPGFDPPKDSDVLGELVTRAWLETALPAEVATRAAAGWGGDRVALYKPVTVRPDGGVLGAGTDAPPALAWLTIWDDRGEADDFSRAAAAVAGEANVQRRGDAVALWLGPSEAAAQAIDGLLDGWRTATSKSRGSRRFRGPADRDANAAPRGSIRCVRNGR